jgi:hypothetical protein
MVAHRGHWDCLWFASLVCIWRLSSRRDQPRQRGRRGGWMRRGRDRDGLLPGSRRFNEHHDAASAGAHRALLSTAPMTQSSRPSAAVTDTQSTPLSPGLAQLLAKALASANQSTPTPTPANSRSNIAPVPTSTPLAVQVTRVPGTPVSTSAGAKSGTKVTGTAICPNPSMVLGGGALVVTNDGQNYNEAQLSSSYASDARTWTATAVVSDGNLAPNETLTITAYALCTS